MYNLPYFRESDKEVILQFIQKHPFAFLSGTDENNKPVATQVPMFIEEKNGMYFLSGHIMRQSDHHQAFVKNANVLALFTGPHTYVSARWYSNPNEASTWNYMSVHVKGKIKFEDSDALISILKKTTLYFENNDSTSPTVFDNLPEEYTHRLMKAIVPFSIEVEKIENVFKLSQNRDEKSYMNIIQKLSEQGGDGLLISEEMKLRVSQLFGKDSAQDKN